MPFSVVYINNAHHQLPTVALFSSSLGCCGCRHTSRWPSSCLLVVVLNVMKQKFVVALLVYYIIEKQLRGSQLRDKVHWMWSSTQGSNLAAAPGHRTCLVHWCHCSCHRLVPKDVLLVTVWANPIFRRKKRKVYDPSQKKRRLSESG
jgi:hypothetical protein